MNVKKIAFISSVTRRVIAASLLGIISGSLVGCTNSTPDDNTATNTDTKSVTNTSAESKTATGDSKLRSSDLLTTFRKIDAVFAINDPSGLGAELAANQAQRKDFFIVGVDGAPDAITAIASKDSLYAATATQNPRGMAQKAVQVGNDILNGKKPKVLNVKKNPIKIAQNMLNFGRKIKVYLFDNDYKFISQDCQRYLERTAKKRLSSIEQSSVL